MFQITQVKLTDDILSFYLDGEKCHLTNSSLLEGHRLEYMWRDPWPQQVQNRYQIYGQGNHITNRDRLEFRIAYFILFKTNAQTFHLMKSSDFWRDMI